MDTSKRTQPEERSTMRKLVGTHHTAPSSTRRRIHQPFSRAVALFATVGIVVLAVAIWHGFTPSRAKQAPAQQQSHWTTTGAAANLDASQGSVLVNGHVLVTGDGGATFTSITPVAQADPSLFSYFLTGSIGWNATTTSDAAGHSSTIAVARTSDAGHSWQSVSLPTFDANPNAHAIGMHFLDAQRGWLAVSLRQGLQSNPGALFTTSDGGATWTPLSLPYAGQVYFLNASTGWLVGSHVPTLQNMLSMTHNGGRTWAPITLPAPVANQSAPAFVGAPMMFTTMDGAVPVTYGKSLQFYSTRDGGSTWSANASFTLSDAENDAVPTSASIRLSGYVAVGQRLFKTQDAGHSWTEVSQPAHFAGAATLHFVSANVGWAYTHGGSCTGQKGSQVCTTTWQIQRTTDGGATWATTYLQTAPY